MGNGKGGSSFLLGLSGEIIHIYPPHGRDREAVLDSGIEKALCHILWGELLAESPQAVDLFLIVQMCIRDRDDAVAAVRVSAYRHRQVTQLRMVQQLYRGVKAI